MSIIFSTPTQITIKVVFIGLFPPSLFHQSETLNPFEVFRATT